MNSKAVIVIQFCLKNLKSENQICVCYLDSKFMAHGTANDLLTNLDVVNNVDGGYHIIQSSMDGPSTNWKFFEMLQKDRIEKELHESNQHWILQLAIIHGAFKTVAESFEWNIKAIFKAVFKILYDAPARGEDYIAIKGKKDFLIFLCNTMGRGHNCCRPAYRNLGQYDQNR